MLCSIGSPSPGAGILLITGESCGEMEPDEEDSVRWEVEEDMDETEDFGERGEERGEENASELEAEGEPGGELKVEERVLIIVACSL